MRALLSIGFGIVAFTGCNTATDSQNDAPLGQANNDHDDPSGDPDGSVDGSMSPAAIVEAGSPHEANTATPADPPDASKLPDTSSPTDGGVLVEGGPQLLYVPRQRRADGVWPELDQLHPRSMGSNEAFCRVSHYRTPGGEWIQSWTWQYDEASGRPIRLTHDVSSGVEEDKFGGGVLVYDEEGRHWSICYSKQSADTKCRFFELPEGADWDYWNYESTCPGEPPAGGFQQLMRSCPSPTDRNAACGSEIEQDENVRYPWESADIWQFTADGHLRRHWESGSLDYADVDCFIDGTLRATGWASYDSGERNEYHPDGSASEYGSWYTGDPFRTFTSTCDESGWSSTLGIEVDYQGRGSGSFSYRGNDPTRPDEVAFTFEHYGTYCPTPESNGTLTGKFIWNGDEVEIVSAEATDAQAVPIVWSVDLNPDIFSAKLDADGNVVEVYRDTTSNLAAVGIRQLTPTESASTPSRVTGPAETAPTRTSCSRAYCRRGTIPRAAHAATCGSKVGSRAVPGHSTENSSRRGWPEARIDTTVAPSGRRARLPAAGYRYSERMRARVAWVPRSRARK